MSTSSSCDQVLPSDASSHFYQPQSDSGNKQLITATIPPLISHIPTQSHLPFHTSIVSSTETQRLETWREVSIQNQPVSGTFVPFVTSSEYEQITRGYQTPATPWESYPVQDGETGQVYASQEMSQQMEYNYCSQKYDSYNYQDSTVKSFQEFDVFHPGDILALEAPIDQKQEVEPDHNRSRGEQVQEFISTNASGDEYIVTSLDDSSASVLPSFCCFEQHQGNLNGDQARIGDPGFVTRFNYCSFFTSNDGIKNSYNAI